MDQVKQYLGVAVKHGFWIGSVLILLGGVAVWFMSTSELSKQTEQQISTIKNDATKISTTRAELPNQPNDLSHALMNGLIEDRTDEVLEAWQTVFDAQTKILTWPEILQDDFVKEFKFVKDEETGEFDESKLKLPFEKYEQFDQEDGDSISPRVLRRYEKYIGRTLPALAEIAGAKWTAKFDNPTGGMMGGMMGGMGGDMMGMGMGMGNMGRGGDVDELTGESDEPVVAWSSGSQDALLKDLFPWRGRVDYPSELEVYYSQENIWILRQLLQIVSAVNGDAKQRFEANIREIKAISMGESVKFDQGNISEPGSRAAGGFGGMGGMGDMGMGMGGMDDYGGDMGGMGGFDDGFGGSTDADEASPDPGDNRYVNTAFEPIDASTLRSAFVSNDPNQVAIAVAKRLPVMLRLQMDQRSIPRLLAACGNAPLMVDVHQIRIMPKGGSSNMGMGMGGDMGMGMGGDMGMGMGGDMGMGMGGDMGMGMGGGGMGMGGGGVSGPADDFPLDMEIEIYGLIYFYNPPSEESLGLDKVVDDVSIDDTVETVDALPGPTDSGTGTTTTPPVDPGTDTTPSTTSTDGDGTTAAGTGTEGTDTSTTTPADSGDGSGDPPADPNATDDPATAGTPAG
ncbi:MAG: hypothetical protein AAFV88_15160 [Planctomycetota bacterium]